MWEWISNYVHYFIWDVVTHSYHNFDDGLTKRPLKSGMDK